MGFSLSKQSNLDKGNKSFYRLEAKEADAMKNLWRVIENDPCYYGWIFSGILFRNHPQYVKYFHDDNIPEFVEDARIKKKFSAICSITSVLFINYSKKPNQRDHVLGYIAMIHKDMHLSSQDLENFMMDFLEMLTQECPQFMNDRCRNFTVEYFDGLLKQIEYLMEFHRNNDSHLMEKRQKFQKRNCGLKSCCNSPTIYGSSIEFWIAKKEYWQNRLAIWSLFQKDLNSLERDDKVHRMENVKFNSAKGTSHPVFSNRKYLPKTKSHSTIKTANSESTNDNLLQNDANTRSDKAKIPKKDRKHYIKHAMVSSTSGPMEVIPEVSSSTLSNVKSPLRRKSSTKNTQAFLDAVKALKTTNILAKVDESSPGSSIKRTTIIDTARERKRARDKKLNIMHSTSDIKHTMASKTLIESKAEKFAEALAKRKA